MQISSLITNSHEWDEPKLQEIFTSDTIQQIIALPILKYPTQDILVWYKTGSSIEGPGCI